MDNNVDKMFRKIYGHQDDGMSKDNIFRLLCIVTFAAPVSIAFTQLYRNMAKDAESVRSRPTDRTYAWAWGIIITLLCLSSIPFIRNTNSKLNMTFALLLVILIVVLGWMWVIKYPTDKKAGISIFVFLAMVVVATVMFYYSVSPVAAVMVSPLLVWVVVQYVVSAKELDMKEGAV